jgi:hypothetical protein
MEGDSNPYQAPLSGRPAERSAKDRASPWLATTILVVPFMSIVVFAVALFLLVSVGLYDRLGKPWDGVAYQATGNIALIVLCLGIVSSLVYVRIGEPRYRVIAVAAGAMNAAIILWGFFH